MKSSTYQTGPAVLYVYGESAGTLMNFIIDDDTFQNEVRYVDPTGAWTNTGYSGYSDDQWFHMRMEWNCTTDTWNLWIDGVQYLTNSAFESSKTDTAVSSMRFSSFELSNTGLYYVDAVSFSWDPNYNVGDNRNEGLLLSYENSTTADWMGYSLDGGANTTILGNTTIPMPSFGSHTIQLFGNTTFGLNNQSEIRHFSYLEYTAPSIEGPGSDLTYEQFAVQNLQWNITEINDGTYSILRNGTEVDSGGFTHWVNVTTFLNSSVDGDWNYTIIATDPSNNQGAYTSIIHIEDMVDPTIEGPSDKVIEQFDTTKTIEWNITEVNDGTFIIKRNDSTIAGPLPFFNGLNVSISMTSTLLVDWNYTIIATDPSGNVAQDTVIVHIRDTVNPVITMLNSSFAVVQGNQSTFYWQITENNPQSYLLYLNGTIVNGSTYINNSIISYTFLNWTIGELFFEVFANDTSGNSHTANITITITQRVDAFIFLTPNETNYCDYINQLGLYVEFSSTEIAFLQLIRQSTNLAAKQPGSQFQAFYFYDIAIFDEDQDENDTIIGSMKVRFYYDVSQVDNVNKLYILHYVFDIADKIWVWRALETTLNKAEGYLEVVITDLSVFCLAEIKGDTNNPFLIFIMDNMLWIIILAAVGVAVPIYVTRSRKQKKGKAEHAKKAAMANYQDMDMETAFKLRAEKKKEELMKRTWKPEEITNQSETIIKKDLDIKAKKKPMKKLKKAKEVQAMTIDAIAEAQEKKETEIKQTEKEMLISAKLDKCTVHKGKIEGISYVCPKCQAKYCLTCAKTLKQKSEGCWVCDTVLRIELKDDNIKIPEMQQEKIGLEPISSQYIENSFLLERISRDEDEDNMAIFRALNLTAISEELLAKIGQIEMDEEDKQEFLKEILALPPDERDDFIEEILQKSRD